MSPSSVHHRLFLCLALGLATVLPAAETPPRSPAGAEAPAVGAAAPHVSAPDQDGHLWKLDEQTRERAVILYFYPKDDTRGCTLEACGFRDQSEALNHLGVSVVGVSRDDAASHQAFRAKHHLNFPLLVDADGKLAEAFGAGGPDQPRSRRVSYLIGRGGKILHRTDNRDANVHLEELKQAVAKLPKP